MKSRTLRVTPLGLRSHELIALKSVCRLSQQAERPIALRVAEAGEQADIFIVATDDPDAVAEWRALDPDADTPFVAAGPMVEPSAAGVHLPKPFLASRLLAAMDMCAVLNKVGAPSDPGEASEALAQRVESRATRTPAPRPLATPPSAPARRSRSILVVDDSATARKQIELVLLDMGLQPHCVVSGEQALEAIENYYFELILLDVVLPGTDGYQVCKAIKKNPRTRNIPVVMLTSKATQFDRIRGKFAGCDTYLTKSLDRAAFTAVMNEYLARMPQGPLFSTQAEPGADPHATVLTG
jgi:two-component system, cell cycle response regulator